MRPWSHRQSVNPLCSLGRTTVIPVGDIACFEGTRAEELVNRRIAVWPEDAERALKPKPGDSDFDTDIG